MQELMAKFRAGVGEVAGKKVEACLDYSTGIDGLPKSDVLKFLLDGGHSLVVRPSGTEPKLKFYISVQAKNKEEAEFIEKEMMESLT